MKLKSVGNKVVYSGDVGPVHTVTVNASKFNLVSRILRNSIYTNKVLAPIRELTANAFDEHKKYNVERPVEVSLDEEIWKVRDFGRGLSEKEIYSVWGMYLESTKDDSDVYIGGFGVGSKSMFAYDEKMIATLISFFEGKKSIYSVFIDGDETKILKVFECDDDSPSGMEVSFPIKNFYNFYNETYNFLQTTKSRVVFFVKGKVEPLNKNEMLYRFSSFNYVTLEGRKNFLVRMGDVCYLLPSRFSSELKTLSLREGMIDVPIGYFDIPISREVITDSESNKKKFDAIVKELAEKRREIEANLKYSLAGEKIFSISCFYFERPSSLRVRPISNLGKENIICIIPDNRARGIWIRKLSNYAVGNPDINYYYCSKGDIDIINNLISDKFSFVDVKKIKFSQSSNKKNTFLFRKDYIRENLSINDFHKQNFKPITLENFQEMTLNHLFWKCAPTVEKKLVKMGWLSLDSPEYSNLWKQKCEKDREEKEKSIKIYKILYHPLSTQRIKRAINKGANLDKIIAFLENQALNPLAQKFLDLSKKGGLTREEISIILKLINDSVHSK